MKKYIAYGSNLNDEFMRDMGHQGECLAIGAIKNSRIRFRGNGYLNLEIEVGDDEVPVAIWEIDTEVEKNIDVYERFPELYSKVDITVQTDEGLVDGFAYIMNEPESKVPAVPEKWYVDVVTKGYEFRRFDKHALNLALEEIGIIG